MTEYYVHSRVMIAKKDRDTITEVAREYGVAKVVLFGSSLVEDREPNDRFYGELMQRLSRPVDLVDLSQRTLFTDLVEETGVTVYG